MAVGSKDDDVYLKQNRATIYFVTITNFCKKKCG